MTVNRAVFEEAVAAAVRAPSMHNTQPWLFRLRDGSVEVLMDRGRLLPWADPTGWGTRISLGAATFNLRLALRMAGRRVSVRWLPGLDEPDVVARLTLGPERAVTPAERELRAAVDRWRSHREPFSADAVGPAERAAMMEAARADSAWLELLTGHHAVAVVAQIVQSANTVLMRADGYRQELAGWTRTDEDCVDGVPDTVGGPTSQPNDLFPQRPFSQRERAPGRDYEAEPLVGILGTVGDLPFDQLAAGYALQHVLLSATRVGLRVSLLSQPIEVPAARSELVRAVGRTSVPQMVLRIGRGVAGGLKAPRRPVAEVIMAEAAAPR